MSRDTDTIFVSINLAGCFAFLGSVVPNGVHTTTNAPLRSQPSDSGPMVDSSRGFSYGCLERILISESTRRLSRDELAQGRCSPSNEVRLFAARSRGKERC